MKAATNILQAIHMQCLRAYGCTQNTTYNIHSLITVYALHVRVCKKAD